LVSFRLRRGAGASELAGAGELAGVVQRLGEQGLWIRSLDDPPCLRACTHITTTASEIEQLLGALAALGDSGQARHQTP
jgi:L-cysteine/cystine lyase